MSVFLYIMLGTIAYFVLKWYVKYQSLCKKMEPFKGPKPLPVVGNALEFTSTEEFIKTLDKYMKDFNGLSKFRVAYRYLIGTTNYELIEYILNSSKLITKSRDYDFLEKWLGRGLLTSTGEKWQKRRKLLTPAFHFQILEQFIEVFHHKSAILVEKLEKEVGKEFVDVYPYVTLCTLDIICETAMGIDIKAQESSEHSEYVKSVKEMGRIVMQRLMSPFKQNDYLYMLSRDYFKERRCLKYLHGITDEVIQKRRQALLKRMDQDTNQDVDEFGAKRRMAFLDILLQAVVDGQPLSDKDIREEVDTFMFEGHDSTSAGISFTLFLLSRHPEIQEKVMEELRSIFNDDFKRPASLQDLQEMKYLEMVIKESMRLYPPVPGFNREHPEDFEFEGRTIPGGVTIGMYIYGLHRDPQHFPNPEQFDPERFTPESINGRRPFAYIPFSAGLRNCIGQKFAMLKLKSTLSKILRHFELKPVDNFKPRLATETILKSNNGILISLRKRHS